MTRMYPELLQIGPVSISSLWFFIGIGFFAALIVINQLVKKTRLKLEFLAEHSLAIFFGGLVMSRIVFILKNLGTFFPDFGFDRFIRLLYVWDKGLSVWGALAGIVLTLYWFCRKEEENYQKWLDVFSVSILSALTFGNIGTFLDGRNYGTETSLPWGVTIENSIYAVPIHPVQIYAAIYCGILTLALMQLFNRKIGREEGNITLIAVFSYGILRFLEEFLRGDESNILLGLREAQIYALLAAVFAAILFYVRKKKRKDKTPTT
jgi:phosphatidylglycerol---prolipoprotein diacylglyceryl transferase